jgi:hypothetical protein
MATIHDRMPVILDPDEARLWLDVAPDDAREMLDGDVPFDKVRASPMVARIARMKEIPNEDFEEQSRALWAEMDERMLPEGWRRAGESGTRNNRPGSPADSPADSAGGGS